ncbi:2'-5' RNA ligase family protein [Nocardioides caldifontis]|uniref:2'-5' RNA ligase family protein n=1 Tax=Nocardioides caldifontis TaxID=2588938 RepID=UPI0019399BEA|nr:2'-5' RNA ligase family protein [Nocardioides caldifontis]
MLLDARGDAAVRRLWRRLEDGGVPTLLTHTHGRHVPHLSYASLRSYDLDAVRDALSALPAREPVELRFDAFGTFRRSRCWLAPAVTAELAQRQEIVATACATTGAELHRHYVPGDWVPHLTLAPRLHLDQLPAVAAAVYDVLPLVSVGTSVALVDTSTGMRHPLPHVV